MDSRNTKAVIKGTWFVALAIINHLFKEQEIPEKVNNAGIPYRSGPFINNQEHY